MITLSWEPVAGFKEKLLKMWAHTLTISKYTQISIKNPSELRKSDNQIT